MENNDFDLETKYVKECIKYNFYIKSQPDYKINDNEVVKVYNDASKLEKKRTKLLKDDYKIESHRGNLFKLQNINNNNVIIKPRAQIKYTKPLPKLSDESMELFKLF